MTLVPHAVTRIGRDHLVVTDGSRHEVDAIIFATGFDVARFVAPIEVTGRNGLRLRDE